MNNEKNINTQAEPEQANTNQTATASAPEISTEEHLNRIATGKMTLLQPIRAAGQDITELKWNFRNLTGWEFASAMDCDNAANVFRISNRQALGLFAASAAKETTIKNDGGVEIRPFDAQDIRQRIGIDDCVKAVQIATVFFVASAREANKRISSM